MSRLRKLVKLSNSQQSDHFLSELIGQEVISNLPNEELKLNLAGKWNRSQSIGTFHRKKEKEMMQKKKLQSLSQRRTSGRSSNIMKTKEINTRNRFSLRSNSKLHI